MFFHPPKDVQTTVFATLPDELKTADATNEWVRFQPAGGPPSSLLEGPSFDEDGNLWCVDLPNGRIYRITPDGTFHVVTQYDGWPNGLKFHKDGRVFIADHKHGIMVLDPVNGKVEPYLVRANLERFKAVNDLFFAANGDLYFTDQGLTGLHDPTGRLFRVAPDGRVSCLLDNVPSPNGLVMNLDESMIYLAVTRGNCVWRVPLLADGGVAKVGVFVQLSGGWGGPDGLALDAEGRLFIAHVGMGSVWVVDRFGEPVYRIRSCAAMHTTNLAFGGPEGRSLFITESGSATILKAELDVPGKPMFSHQP
ncbi:SMP-30/gluconolactonase/LRE family protein [Chelatococcus sp. GCM10030263]|uniref:SMP-30/gluconolactonase/LRE family protein n=1 Tax=Chelatococcus sp. GCM10030263 TaxID=3273387 RepID=UPI003615D008